MQIFDLVICNFFDKYYSEIRISLRSDERETISRLHPKKTADFTLIKWLMTIKPPINKRFWKFSLSIGTDDEEVIQNSRTWKHNQLRCCVMEKPLEFTQIHARGHIFSIAPSTNNFSFQVFRHKSPPLSLLLSGEKLSYRIKFLSETFQTPALQRAKNGSDDWISPHLVKVVPLVFASGYSPGAQPKKQ